MNTAILRFWGHAAFSVETATTRLLIDPHRPGALGGRFSLPAIVGPFDALVSSHPHEDHAGWTPALGTRAWIERPSRVGDLSVSFCAAPHDDVAGLRMGLSRLIRIEGPDFVIVHSGDLGCDDPAAAAFCTDAAVLLIAAGGTYTLAPGAAAAFARATGARVVVPMHCADPAVDLPLAPAADFFAAWAALGAPVAALGPRPQSCITLPPPASLRGAVALERTGDLHAHLPPSPR